MSERTESVTNLYERGDGVYGIVSSRCGKGAFIELENGEIAFAYKICGLRSGTKVLCTVVRPPHADRGYLVELDSVCSLYEVA